MDYYQHKYLKYKKKYLYEKNRFVSKLKQNGGDQSYDKWKNNYPNLLPLIDYLIKEQPTELTYMVPPDSIRGNDLVKILKRIVNDYPNEPADLRWLYGGWNDIDSDRVELLILTLECYLFVEKEDDKNLHFDLGTGGIDENIYNNINLEKQSIYNKIVSKYPYTKPLCIFGYDCPYFDSKNSFSNFREPYNYFALNICIGKKDAIIAAADIINNKKESDASEEAKSHYHNWGHLPPLPSKIYTDFIYSDSKEEPSSFLKKLKEIYKFNPDLEKEIEKLEYINDKILDNGYKLNYHCKTSEERIEWGKNDYRWRALYPYITELCLPYGGLFYWD